MVGAFGVELGEVSKGVAGLSTMMATKTIKGAKVAEKAAKVPPKHASSVRASVLRNYKPRHAATS